MSKVTTGQPTGAHIVTLAKRHIGEKYVFGKVAPKDDAHYTGPWDCAEFVSWVVNQLTGELYGCTNGDAYTGHWQRDARNGEVEVCSVSTAMKTPGAILLRRPRSGAIGHIVFSDGYGGTIEARSTKYGVMAYTANGRRWDTGILIPGVEYEPTGAHVRASNPKLYLQSRYMRGPEIKALQVSLMNAGHSIDPDGIFGKATEAAVIAFQREHGLVVDGEVGPETLAELTGGGE